MDKLECVQESHFSENIWYCASTAAQDAEIPDLVNVLAIFIQQQQIAEEEENRTSFGQKKIQAGFLAMSSRSTTRSQYGNV